MRALNAKPTKHPLDLAKAHSMIVQQDCQFDRLAIRPLTLKNLISSGTSINSGSSITSIR